MILTSPSAKQTLREHALFLLLVCYTFFFFGRGVLGGCVGCVGESLVLLLLLLQAVEVLVVLHTLHVLDVVAVAGHVEQRLHERAGVVAVQVRPPLAEDLRGVLGPVVRHLEGDVVHDVRGADVVVHVVDDGRVVAVHAARRAAHVREVTVGEVRDLVVRVVQPRVEHQPAVRHDVGAPEPEERRAEAVLVVDVRQDGQPRKAAEGARQDHVALVVVEHLAARLEVAERKLPVELLAVGRVPAATRRVLDQVQRPAQDKVLEDVPEDEGVLTQGLEESHVQLRAVLVARDVALTVEKVVREHVVLVVRVAPRPERHQQRRVRHETDDVVHPVEGTRAREGAVSALVSDDPQARQRRAHHDRVDRPQHRPLGEVAEVRQRQQAHEGNGGVDRQVVGKPGEGQRQAHVEGVAALLDLGLDGRDVGQGVVERRLVADAVDGQRNLAVALRRHRAAVVLDRLDLRADLRLLREHVVVRLVVAVRRNRRQLRHQRRRRPQVTPPIRSEHGHTQVRRSRERDARGRPGLLEVRLLAVGGADHPCGLEGLLEVLREGGGVLRGGGGHGDEGARALAGDGEEAAQRLNAAALKEGNAEPHGLQGHEEAVLLAHLSAPLLVERALEHLGQVDGALRHVLHNVDAVLEQRSRRRILLLVGDEELQVVKRGLRGHAEESDLPQVSHDVITKGEVLRCQ
eukprot:Rhum_TRINITY_DN15176_c9_g1::Rhum_TRINITY_DN15176_c9_g1_i1::g.142397::m.142397